MNEQSKKEVSQEIGLEISYLFGKYFLKLEHLHYGYWTKGLAIDISNLRIAQDEYAKFVISHIPSGVKTILDVGCGTGQISKMLLEKGYEVDCLSPSAYFNEQIRNSINSKVRLFETSYEEFQTNRRYDLILFCESFQYVDMGKALSKTIMLLNKNGYMLICDLFKRDLQAKGAIGGGQKLNKFYEFVEKVPFRLIENVDITEQAAPNIDLMDDMFQKVVQPMINAGFALAESRNKIITKILKWKYRKKIDKLDNKYFSGARNGKHFKLYKTYQFFLYKKK
jgi:SAM-dependent methyltransferase